MNHLPLEPRPRPHIIAFICPRFHGEQQGGACNVPGRRPSRAQCMTLGCLGGSWRPWNPGAAGSHPGRFQEASAPHAGPSGPHGRPSGGASILPVRHSREQHWLAAVKKTSVCADVALSHFLRVCSSPPSVRRNQEGPDAQQGEHHSASSQQKLGVAAGVSWRVCMVQAGPSQLSSLSLFHSFQEPQNQTRVS